MANVAIMQAQGTSSDRVSISSTLSTSSHGSAQADLDSFRDVYVWGDLICDPNGTDNNTTNSNSRCNVLLPKPLESNVGLDIHRVACGVKHAALVTRQGEVFTWGEESGGHLGHGNRADAIRPRLVEPLLIGNVDFVACGEFHTCAISTNGELYTWGDGTYKAGLLGHGNDYGHWIPRRVLGPLDGLKVAYVSCGSWHTALITSAGQLFTFGDGTFGALGHGNRENVHLPKEVEALTGVKTIDVSCGLWHTAAIVEIVVRQSSASLTFGKLFTWGDGDKYRLGHGDKEPRLKPTCVSSLIDYSFHKVACGHSITVSLTTSGSVYTTGSNAYGQLGNPRADGRLPCLVEDKLATEYVGEIACGSYHVAVLTAKNEVYTWGKGTNGRLGHGDIEDRKTPTLVEALRDRPVKHIACGSNFTAAICHHKWISGAEYSQCSNCKQTFGFTRKKHNCYNCGRVYCHSCSSRKAFNAALSPNPRKAYRVCDLCYAKLSKVAESCGVDHKKNAASRISAESIDKLERSEMSQVPSYWPPRDIAFARGVDPDLLSRPMGTSISHSAAHSRTVSPFSRKSSPPHSSAPVSTVSGQGSSQGMADSLKRTNELLTQEIQQLRSQIDSLRQRWEQQEYELFDSEKRAEEAILLASQECAKSEGAKEVIKSLTTQLKDLAERLPPEIYIGDSLGPTDLPNVIDKNLALRCYSDRVHELKTEDGSTQSMKPALSERVLVGSSKQDDSHETEHGVLQMNLNQLDSCNNDKNKGDGEILMTNNKQQDLDNKELAHMKSSNAPYKFSGCNSSWNLPVAEWVEQYEPGVYITLTALLDGTKDLKRVRFSRRIFAENQAEAWWSENRDKVYVKYNIPGSDRASSVSSTRSSMKPD